MDGIERPVFRGRIAAFGRKAEFSPKYIVAEKERQALLYQVKVRIDRDLDVFKIGMPVTSVRQREARWSAWSMLQELRAIRAVNDVSWP